MWIIDWLWWNIFVYFRQCILNIVQFQMSFELSVQCHFETSNLILYCKKHLVVHLPAGWLFTRKRSLARLESEWPTRMMAEVRLITIFYYLFVFVSKWQRLTVNDLRRRPPPSIRWLNMRRMCYVSVTNGVIQWSFYRLWNGIFLLIYWNRTLWNFSSNFLSKCFIMKNFRVKNIRMNILLYDG